MKRLEWVSALMALAVFVGPSIAEPAAAAIAPAPLGLDVNGSEYALISNNGWTVSSNNDGTFRPAKAVILSKPPTPGAFTAFDRQQYAYIWAPTCTASKQILKFRRTYFLPGPPKTLGATFYDFVQHIETRKHRNQQRQHLLQRHARHQRARRIISFANIARPKLTRLLRFGQNTIDIVVVKRPRAGDFGKCASQGKPLGVLFNISGDFEADAWIAKDFNTEELYARARSTDSEAVLIITRPKNSAPRQSTPENSWSRRLAPSVPQFTLRRFRERA